MNFSGRLKELRKREHLTQQDLANKLNVDRTSVGKWETNRNLANNDILQKICSMFDVTMDYLLGRTDCPTATTTSNNSESLCINLPFLNAQKATDKSKEKNTTFNDPNLKIDFCIKASGDSMKNARISDGDIVLIKKQDNLENGEIGAVLINNEIFLRRVYFFPEQKRLMLQSENPAYAPSFFEGDELNAVKILGKAVAVQSKL